MISRSDRKALAIRRRAERRRAFGAVTKDGPVGARTNRVLCKQARVEARFAAHLVVEELLDSRGDCPGLLDVAARNTGRCWVGETSIFAVSSSKELNGTARPDSMPCASLGVIRTTPRVQPCFGRISPSGARSFVQKRTLISSIRSPRRAGRAAVFPSIKVLRSSLMRRRSTRLDRLDVRPIRLTSCGHQAHAGRCRHAPHRPQNAPSPQLESSSTRADASSERGRRVRGATN